MSQTRVLGIGALTVLLLLSGCLGVIGHQNLPERHQTPPASPDQPNCAMWVSFYGIDSPDAELWTPSQVSIGYTLPADVSVFFVVSENGEVLGYEHESTEGVDSGVTADGDSIELDEPLTGVHEINITAYTDVNDNGQFDADTDKPCQANGELVRTGPKAINFSQFDTPGENETPSPSTPRPDETPTLTPTP